MRRNVMGADAAVEALIDAGRDSPGTGEKTMADRGRGRKQGGVQHDGVGVRGGTHGSNPGRGPSRRGAEAIALNRPPLPVRAWLVRRLEASLLLAARSAGGDDFWR